jgi:hypothetical protein
MHVVIDRETYEFPAGWSVLDGSMTRRTKDNELRPADFLDVSPDDVRWLDVHDRRRSRGQPVRVCDAASPAESGDSARTNVRHLSVAWRLFLDALTGPRRDQTTGTPECKVTAVRSNITGHGLLRSRARMDLE